MNENVYEVQHLSIRMIVNLVNTNEETVKKFLEQEQNNKPEEHWLWIHGTALKRTGIATKCQHVMKHGYFTFTREHNVNADSLEVIDIF